MRLNSTFGAGRVYLYLLFVLQTRREPRRVNNQVKCSISLLFEFIVFPIALPDDNHRGIAPTKGHRRR